MPGNARDPGIAPRRLRMQRLVGSPFPSAMDAVRTFGAVQSQDYAGAKWALGLRVRGLTDRGADVLFDEGRILRTHVLRPTWHFVLPRDVRWMLELTAPRIRAAMAYYDRKLELDAPLLRRAYRVLEAALRDGAYKTRTELAAVLKGARIRAKGQRLGHVMGRAELDAVIVSGPRRGKQMTYALFDERAGAGPRLAREEALAELARRYFTGHGPAQVPDFTWWSGLSADDAKRGLAAVRRELREERVGERTYWSAPEAPPAARGGPPIHLLPNFDEFIVAYRDRSDAIDPAVDLEASRFPPGGILSHTVLWRGRVWGAWRRRQQGVRLRVTPVALGPLDRDARAALAEAVSAYGRFLGTPVDFG